MSEFEDKLGAILGDQAAMVQIMSLAQSLSTGPEAAPETSETPASAVPPTTDFTALLGALGDTDPRLLQRAAAVFARLSAGDDRRTELLHALRPFLKEERQGNLDRAIRIARLSRALRAGLELFREKGEEHV